MPQDRLFQKSAADLDVFYDRHEDINREGRRFQSQ